MAATVTLATAELASLRADAERTLGSVCAVVTIERSRDARGNVAEVAVTGPDFACHVAPSSMLQGSTEGLILAAIDQNESYSIMFGVETQVTVADKIMVEVEEGVRLLEVVASREIQTNAILYRVMAVEAPN